MTAPSLLAELARDLQQHAPFDAMPDEDIHWLIQRLGVRYFPVGSIILSAGSVPDGLFIVRRGTVKSEDTARNAALHALVHGELFPLGALLGQRPTLSTFRAETDCFCYYLAAPDFHELRAKSQRFQDFCTRRIAHLLDLSRQRLQTTYASHVVRQTLDIPLKEVAHPPITCLPHASLREVLITLRQKRIGSMVVVDAAGAAKGIFTLNDLLRITIDGVDLDTAISNHMSTKLVHLPSWHRAFDAAVTMAKHGIHHLLVIDDAQLTGVVSEKDLFGLQRVSLNQLAETIAHADAVDDFEQIQQDLNTLQQNMLAQGVTAGQLARGMVALTDPLVRRILHITKPEDIHDDIGFVWLLGDEHGRQEVSVGTAPALFLVLNDTRQEKLLMAWVDHLSEYLAAVGWSNSQIQLMKLDAVLQTIPTDARWIMGNVDIARQIQAQSSVLLLEQAPQILSTLSTQSNELNIAESAIHPKLIQQGLEVFIYISRILAALENVSATNTVERLSAVGELLRWPTETVSAWCEAFQFLWLLPLSNPRSEEGRDEVIGLNDLDVRILKEALRQARKLLEFATKRMQLESGLCL
ncbi:CBS domain-containing protein [Leeia sp. TBRC 13508]|uniref:CBS domain-containing protein n=1 Tax=Leeia speluncae TaxID=2884804 RepID=A0ABS8D189_9NEIS|nr:CBS domain-containing protein [Leeia speluncae]MCB6181954.1 CBS domain-containing protein [Leeia speluncae]